MANKVFRRPDEAAMRRVLTAYKGRIEEIALRFAWTMGLSVSEMIALTWNDVSFETREVRVADRNVPMDEEMLQCLQVRFDQPKFREKEYIMISDTRLRHTHRVNLSNYARIAMDTEEDLRDVNLIDLREDFVIRQLEQHDWAYVLRITGLSTRSLYATYGQYVQKEKHRRRGTGAREIVFSQDDEFKFWKLVQEEDTSAVGIALWMVWQLGFSLQECADLTWEQVNLDAGIINIESRQVPMGTALQRRLRTIFNSHRPDDDPHVLLNPKARRPYGADRLSVVIGEALVRNDMLNYDLSSLRLVREQQQMRETIRTCLQEKGWFSLEEVSARLSQSEEKIRQQIHLLIKEGEIARVGTKYYKVDEIVHPEQHRETILKYIEEHGVAMRKELASLLGLGDRQCTWIMDKLISDGKVVRLGNKYYLPGAIKPEEEYSEEFFESGYKMIQEKLKEEKYVRQNQVSEMLQIGEKACSILLLKLVNDGKLVRLGRRYYLPDTIIPPEEHGELVQAYLKEHGKSMRKNLADLLQLDEDAAFFAISKLVDEGKIVRDGRYYRLPEIMN